MHLLCYCMEFTREQTAWPLCHALVPAALYVAAQDVIVALLLMYAWETLEYLIYLAGVASLKEDAGDSRLGDPLQGAASIAAVWIWTTTRSGVVAATFSLWFRIIVLFGGAAVFSAAFDPAIPGAAIGAVYILVVGLAYNAGAIVWTAPDDGPDVAYALVAWLVIAVLQVAAFATTTCQSNARPWVRVFAASLAALTAGVIVYAATGH